MPHAIDTTRPTSARVYDYMVGGTHHFEPDRKIAEQLIALFPHAKQAARVNRAFLRRAVRFLIERGIDQFLDVGSGIPATGNVHEVAQELRPGARVVYVDIDPVAVAHGEQILAGNPDAAMIQGDVRRIDEVLAHPEVRRLLDPARPVGVLFGAVFHFLPDDAEVRGILARVRAWMAPGSWLAVTHTTHEGVPAEMIAQMHLVYSSSTSALRYRSTAEVRALVDGFALADPGVVPSALWRPDGPHDLFVDTPALSLAVAAVGERR